MEKRLEELDARFDPLDAAASEHELLALLPEAKEKDADPRILIQLHSLISRAEAHLGKHPQARASLAHAEALLKESQEAVPAAVRIRFLIEEGRLHVLEKTPSRARRPFAEAWTLATGSGQDYLAVEVAQLLAATEPQKSQQEWITQAIEIAARSADPRAKLWLGGLYASLGWKLFDLRQFDRALETFQESLRRARESGTPRDSFVAQWSIGKVFRAQGRTEEALGVQKALLAELGIGGVRDGRLYEEVAECLQTLRQPDEARLYFELAYRELSSDAWAADNRPVDLKRLKAFGKVK
jgi:tetratricopeptide (TPR) repeat protein